jgi:hypothetical protein
MTAPPAQIPGPADVIGPGIDALLEVRPSAAPHVDLGRYGDVIAGTRAQFEVARRRLVQETLGARLPYSEGDALTDLAASEYDTPRTTGAVESIGEVVLARTVVHYTDDAANILSVDLATDEQSFIDLVNTCVFMLIQHAVKVWNSAQGIGSHASTANFPNVPSVTLGGPMSQHIGAANQLKLDINTHLAGAWHLDADTVNVVTTDDAFASEPIIGFISQTAASRASALAVVNACYTHLVAHMRLQSKAGTIRAGTVWSVLADPTAVPPIVGAQYQVEQDTPVPTGQQSVTVPVLATRTGAFANIPAWAAGGPTPRYTTPTLFDAAATMKLATTSIKAAGGSDGQTDPELRRAAGAAALGSAGPTVPALVAGALRTVGASRTVVREDYTTGAAVVYPVDASWAQSTRWNATVEQILRDTWLGFGCRLTMGTVQNRIVRIDATVALRDAAYLADTSAITTAIQNAIRAYFDDRVDWYVWRTAALKAVVARADRARISTCPQLIVRDQDGVALTEPAIPSAGSALTHWVFADNAVSITYTQPA